MYVDAEGVFAKLKGAVQHYLSKDKTAEYRKMALLGSLPKWNGFGVVDEEIPQMTATKAIEELDHVMYCLSDVWIEEHHNYRKKQPSQFDARKVNGPSFVVDCFFLCSQSMPQERSNLSDCIYAVFTLLRSYQEVSSSLVFEL